jgi:hypothetical protein
LVAEFDLLIGIMTANVILKVLLKDSKRSTGVNDTRFGCNVRFGLEKKSGNLVDVMFFLPSMVLLDYSEASATA